MFIDRMQLSFALQLVAERPSAPQLAKPAQPDAKAAFFDARRSYDINRIKSLWTTNALA